MISSDDEDVDEFSGLRELNTDEDLHEESSGIPKLKGEQSVHFCTKVMPGDDSLSACGETIFFVFSFTVLLSC